MGNKLKMNNYFKITLLAALSLSALNVYAQQFKTLQEKDTAQYQSKLFPMPTFKQIQVDPNTKDNFKTIDQSIDIPVSSPKATPKPSDKKPVGKTENKKEAKLKSSQK